MAQARAGDLKRLAHAQFGALSPAEEELLNRIASGDVAVCGPNGDLTDPRNRPDNADTWGLDRQIRAELFAWLCTNETARTLVHPRGIWVVGAKFTDPINLESVKIPFPILLYHCRLTNDLNLRRAELSQLDLQGSHVEAIVGDGLNVKNNLLLRFGFSSNGGLRLLGAQIGGNLECQKATITKKSGDAFNADGINVTGSVFLKQTKVVGVVRLLAAEIGNNLECDESTFSNPNDVALALDEIHVKRGMFLRNGFTAEGQVRLLHAQIGGNFDCTKAHFKHEKDRALGAEQINVGGYVFLKEVNCRGEVRLLGAQIGADLVCDNGVFSNASGSALMAERITVNGYVFMRCPEFYGEVRLVRAQVGATLECRGGSFTNPGDYALNAEGISVKGDITLTDALDVIGEVRLVGAQVGGNVNCTNAAISNQTGYALSASGILVHGSVLLGRSPTLKNAKGLRAKGEVSLSLAQIEGQFDCRGSVFAAHLGRSLTASRAIVKSSVLLSQGFAAEGKVDLNGAEIGGDLDCEGGTFENPAAIDVAESGIALTAMGIHVNGSVFLRARPEKKGRRSKQSAK